MGFVGLPPCVWVRLVVSHPFRGRAAEWMGHGVVRRVRIVESADENAVVWGQDFWGE
jgi:hypothetical protein